MLPALIWTLFATAVLVVGMAGYTLSRYGDVIAEKTGLSGTWIGFVLLATVTSLPELITGVSAVALARAPNIALGNVLGACVFNLALIVLLDFLQRGESVYTRASRGHVLSAGFGVILIGFIGFNLLLAGSGAVWAIGHVGFYSPAILIIYLVAMRTVYRYERQQMAAFSSEVAERYPHLTMAQATRRYAFAALLVIGVGAGLPFLGEAMATAMGWHRTFVGTFFIALATTTPELAVTVAALRLGALDMAIGNLFGSILFNLVIVAVDDVFFLQGPLLSLVSPIHAVSVLSAMMMMGVAIVGLLYPASPRFLKNVGWASLFLLSLYLLNAYVLYLYGE
ncbi:hypothetical protein RG903_02030 [Thermithiobacillus tepidarius DSM 3134]|uniref:sodium:calcium antiporter n=1 Tax=Thermithiobacillus tepidarius TaxID=929 RepID=UPI00040F1DBE|nr:cation transporter [Thermithiobacillus tepidarius]